MKISMDFFFHEPRTNYPKIHIITKDANWPKQSWGGKTWKYHPLWMWAILQSYIHQNSMVLAQKHINQWKRTDNSEINPCTYDQLIYSVTKKNEILPLATTWMDPEGIFLSEISQTEKDKYCLYMWNLKN